MWYTKGVLISLSRGFVEYQYPYDLLGSFILPYSVEFVYTVFIIVVINHNDRLFQMVKLLDLCLSLVYNYLAFLGVMCSDLII